MSVRNNPPFGSGQTYFAGTNATTTGTARLLGSTWQFVDQGEPSQNTLTTTVGRAALRSASGFVRTHMAIRANATLRIGTQATQTTCSRMIALNTASFGLLGVANGKGAPTRPHAFPIDDRLTTGVVTNDIFYVVVNGPCLARMTGGTIQSGTALRMTSNGLLAAAITATQVVGVLMEKSTMAGQLATIWVDGSSLIKHNIG